MVDQAVGGVDKLLKLIGWHSGLISRDVVSRKPQMSHSLDSVAVGILAFRFDTPNESLDSGATPVRNSEVYCCQIQNAGWSYDTFVY